MKRILFGNQKKEQLQNLIVSLKPCLLSQTYHKMSYNTNSEKKKRGKRPEKFWNTRKSNFKTKKTEFKQISAEYETNWDKDLKTPFQYFIEYIPPSLLGEIAFQTNLYSVQNNSSSIGTSADEIQKLIGIHIHMGTLGFPRYRMYWTPSSRISVIADTMTFN